MKQQGVEGIDPQRGSVHCEAYAPGAGGVTIDQTADAVAQFQPVLKRVALQPERQQPMRMAGRWHPAQELLDLVGENATGAIAL